MPELPEVENVKQSLKRLGTIGQEFASIQLNRKGLRTPFNKDMARGLIGQTIQGIERRAKFLLFETDHYFIISHLGMSGSWRVEQETEIKIRKHDHVVFQFHSGANLILNDPRRFGLLEFCAKEKLAENPWLRHLGVEPLDKNFTAEALFQKLERARVP